MTTRKKKTAVSEAAVMEAIREALEGADPRTAGLTENWQRDMWICLMVCRLVRPVNIGHVPGTDSERQY